MNIDQEISSRIHNNTVGEVYKEWKKCGLLDETHSFLDMLSPDLREPIEQSFITHVHKEKGLFIYLMGEQISVNRPALRVIATSADILWAMSLMIDDMIPKDREFLQVGTNLLLSIH